MKKIVGLDIGTNSIGWSVVQLDFDNQQGSIVDAGSRIIPMDAETLGNFESGQTVSKTAGRRQARGARRMRQRYKLRRERLVRVLRLLGWLPEDFGLGSILRPSLVRLEECRKAFNGQPIPEDWLPYFLRSIGTTQKLELEELARVLLHMNQRRGFKSNRKANNEAREKAEEGNEEEGSDSMAGDQNSVEIVRIAQVFDLNEKSRGKSKFELVLADGRRGEILRDAKPDWENQDKELEVRIRRSSKGERIEFAIPKPSDWQKKKEALQKSFLDSGLHPGAYFFKQLQTDPHYRIRERIIDRVYFRNEMQAIWNAQKAFHPTLSDSTPLQAIADVLYPKNQEKNKEIRSNDLFHVLANDIIYHQRPLKSQVHSIAECRFEKRSVLLGNKRTGETFRPGIKVAPASSPVFQEFRIWKTIHNLQIFEKQREVNGRIETDVDVTRQILTQDVKAALFAWWDEREEVEIKDITKFLNLKEEEFGINYPEGTKFPGNTTWAKIRKVVSRIHPAPKRDKNEIPEAFETRKKEYQQILNRVKEQLHPIWHLLYSVDEEEAIRKSLANPKGIGLDEPLALALSRLPAYPSQYAAYSAKAMNKLLPLMRCGRYWSIEAIPESVAERIQSLLVDPETEDLPPKVLGQLMQLKQVADFQGLPEWMATYVAYGRHSERVGFRVENPDQMQSVKPGSLRNPVVEQIVNETVQLMKDIWKKFGQPDEIRVELARDLKKTAKERKKANEEMFRNREDKLRIKAILEELKLEGSYGTNSDVEKWRIAEENANYSFHARQEKFFKKNSEPTRAEIERYMLWMEQRCFSPYTGKPIILSRLFTNAYEVEHVIPRSRYFDDSMGNKVIVETAANKEKANRTAMQYILDGSTKGIALLSPDAYVAHVNRYFFGKKRTLLLSEKVPDGFINRQLNDTRHISRQIVDLLSQVIDRDKIRTSIGSITDRLKDTWKLDEVYKRLLIDRFKRFSEVAKHELVGYVTDKNGNRWLHLKGFEKRIDHRHHALDAIVIACTTQSHIQYINSLEAQSRDESMRFQFQKLLGPSRKTYDFRLPWPGFIEDTHQALDRIVVSFKNRHRILAKGLNKNWRWVEKEPGKWIKEKVVQESGERPVSIRKPLHKETINGTVQLRDYRQASLKEAIEKVEFVADKTVKTRIRQLIHLFNGNLAKIQAEVKANPIVDAEGKKQEKILIWELNKYTLARVKLDDSFDVKKIAKIAEYDNKKGKGLKALLLSHLEEFGGNSKLAFTGEGLEALCKKAGKPVSKVSIYEPIGNKFEVRPGQYVEAAKGTNLFFVIYVNQENPQQRLYQTLSFKDVVECKSKGLPFVEEKPGYKWFLLSPNDLVYVPEPGEDVSKIDWQAERARVSKRIYKMVSSTGNRCFFVPATHIPITLDLDGKAINEFGSLNKIELAADGVQIKSICQKLKFDRLGNISLT